MVSRQAVIEKTHDIEALVESRIPFESKFQDLEDAAEVLTPYATEFRYPRDLVEPNKSDAEEAIEMAQLVINFVLEQLQDEISDREA